MIRLSWLQFRLQAFIAAGLLAIFAAFLIWNGRQLYHLYDTTVGLCAAGTDCSPVQNQFLNHDNVLWHLLGLLLLLAPALLGIFWGAPLVAREYENGTFRLAWTQSVSRGRWLLVKLGLIGLASVIVAGVLGLLYTWWSRPFEWITMERFTPGPFDERGVVVMGYALFAFALGITAGVILRRMLPAMAVTMVGFVAARLAFTFLVRPHLMSPVQISKPLSTATGLGFSPSAAGITFTGGTPSIPNAWAISSKIVDGAGTTANNTSLHAFLVNACPAIVNNTGVPQPSSGATHVPVSQGQQVVFNNCIDQLSKTYHLVVSYQPASRYWTFQWSEMAIFIVLSLLLMTFCFWWLRRRIA